MLISLIVAVSRDNCIGLDGDLPWHLPADLQYFKTTTFGHHVLMGRRCYESIPPRFRPLPGRPNLVLTRQTNFEAPGAVVVNSLPAGIELARFEGETELFVIGGAQIYKLALPLADRLYLTRVETTVDQCDTFFPKLDLARDWQLLSTQKHEADPKNAFACTFECYERLAPDSSQIADA